MKNWVTPEHMGDLSWFTLAILDVVTISAVPGPSAPGRPPPVLAPRERGIGTAVIP